MTVKQKLTIAAVGLVSLSQSGHAANMMKDTYIGLQGGFDYVNAKSDNLTQVDTNTPVDNFAWKGKKKNTSIVVNALVGREVARIASDMPVSVEFSFGFNTSPNTNKAIDVDNAFTPQELRVRQTWKTGLSALFGKSITNDLTAALKLGVVYSNFDVRYGLDTGTGVYQTAPGKSKTMRLFGFEPGVRLSYSINECTSAHLEGTYTMYQSKRKTFLDDRANLHRVSSKIAPRVWGLKAGVTYKF